MQHMQVIADSMRISPIMKSKMRMIGWSSEKTARGVRALVLVKFILVLLIKIFELGFYYLQTERTRGFISLVSAKTRRR